MSATGLCEICQRPDVDHTCDRCGLLVCDRHFDAQRGVCAECVAELTGERDGSRQPGSGPDGVDTYQF